MFIFEGRMKGATTTLLTEALRNNGIYVSTLPKNIINAIIGTVYEEGRISAEGREYLLNNSFSYRDDIHGKPRKKVYFDNALEVIQAEIVSKYGDAPEIIALGNDDIQVVDPRHIQESYNKDIRTSVMDAYIFGGSESEGD